MIQLTKKWIYLKYNWKKIIVWSKNDAIRVNKM